MQSCETTVASINKTVLELQNYSQLQLAPEPLWCKMADQTYTSWGGCVPWPLRGWVWGWGRWGLVFQLLHFGSVKGLEHHVRNQTHLWAQLITRLGLLVVQIHHCRYHCHCWIMSWAVSRVGLWVELGCELGDQDAKQRWHTVVVGCSCVPQFWRARAQASLESGLGCGCQMGFGPGSKWGPRWTVHMDSPWFWVFLSGISTAGSGLVPTVWSPCMVWLPNTAGVPCTCM